MFAIGEAARRSGVSIETIRYYEREGIIAAPRRSTNGRRVFSEAEISALRFIRRCRDLGFSIRDALALRRLASDPAAGCEKVQDLGQRHLADIRSRIASLRALDEALSELVANCAEGKRDCPMLDRLMSDRDVPAP